MTTSMLTLPVAGSSMPLAIYRLEAISCAIHGSFSSLCEAGEREEAYGHFRVRAFRLLTHYVDSGLQDAFRWLLRINAAAPKRTRIELQENPFHWGLLAMTSAAGTFMSRNKLRALGAAMKLTHSQGVTEANFENFVRRQHKLERERALGEFRDF